jgi:hypothetical protein
MGTLTVAGIQVLPSDLLVAVLVVAALAVIARTAMFAAATPAGRTFARMAATILTLLLLSLGGLCLSMTGWDRWVNLAAYATGCGVLWLGFRVTGLAAGGAR